MYCVDAVNLSHVAGHAVCGTGVGGDPGQRSTQQVIL